ncbi:MAG: alkyl hydroperoxide reductase/Thiol specific antioxidant/Mal allergen [Verrucomicrobiaceae bacterium]|nr:alkyl hydroperoxide reductase/Thiol specific antioxidant/Mal allergen [Verrucomicrobiaceae bacterium]
MQVLRILFLFALIASPALGDEAPGHSLHGEAFNEGPRQAAVLMEGMPKIDFPITTKSPEAQKFFTQGVAQQHGFWYFEAERSHRQASALDPDAAMPYWGMALANVNNEKRAKGFLLKAVERKAGASRREQMWITSLENFYKDDKRDKKQRQLDYIRDLEAIVQDFPQDIEAKAFLVWKIWDANGDVPISSNQAVDALLDQIFAVNPMHPAHHYRIHLWDSDKPARALGSDSKCGQTSPGIAHMWHMPGHTFSKLGRYDDAAWQQEAATRVDHAYMIKTLVLPDQIHNYAHNEEWLTRTYGELGRVQDAIALATNLIENPRHPVYNTLEKPGTSASYGRTRLLETLTEWELWPQILQMNGGPLLPPTTQNIHEINRLRAVGLAQYHTDNQAALATTISGLEALEATMKKDKPALAQTEEVRKALPVKSEMPAPVTSKPETAKPDPAKKALPSALAELRAASLILKKAETGKIRDILDKDKDIPKSRLIGYFLRLDDKKKAGELAGHLDHNLTGWMQQAEVYQLLGRTDDAKKAFESARERGFGMDRDLPVGKRLDALALTFGIKDDWRKPAPVRTDSGARPALDSLGPVHWSPPKAPAWSGTGLDGKPVSNETFAGKPTLLIFYVGHYCTHCMAQLKAFEEVAGDFKSMGINIVAMSPDALADLPKAQKNAKSKAGFPFPLVSAKLDVFRAYRAYDDFEQFPLHVVALVDARQHLRWLDVGYNPFMEAKFVLEEAKRLLALPTETVAKK